MNALRRLVDWAGNDGAHVLYIPWASSVPAESYAYFKGLLQPLLSDAGVQLAEDPTQGPDSYRKFSEQLKWATAVFFSGGDQATLLDHVESVAGLLDVFKGLAQKGMVFGGTSAGLAAMPVTMLTGKGDFTVLDPTKVETRSGLGLVTGVLLDQHFVRRNRMNRLISVLQGSTESCALGVDEDSAISVENNTVETFGESALVILHRRPQVHMEAASFGLELIAGQRTFRLGDLCVSRR